MLKFLKLALLCLTVAGATAGGAVIYLQRGAMPALDTTVAEPPPQPIFAELDPFTVTLYDQTRSRILYVGITLRLEDIPSRRQIQDYMPEVRDRILRVLSSQELPGIRTTMGRQALADSLKLALEEPFNPQANGSDIADVLFTAFVVQ